MKTAIWLLLNLLKNIKNIIIFSSITYLTAFYLINLIEEYEPYYFIQQYQEMYDETLNRNLFQQIERNVNPEKEYRENKTEFFFIASQEAGIIALQFFTFLLSINFIYTSIKYIKTKA